MSVTSTRTSHKWPFKISKQSLASFNKLRNAVGCCPARGQMELLESRVLLSGVTYINSAPIAPASGHLTASVSAEQTVSNQSINLDGDSSDPLVVTSQPPSSMVAGQSFGVVITAENGD